MENQGTSFLASSTNDSLFELNVKHTPSNTTTDYNNVWKDISYDIPKKSGQLTPNKEFRISLNDDPPPVIRSSNASGRIGRGGDEVVVCSSNGAFDGNSTLMRTKTKSRLMDQSDIDQRSSNQKKSKSGNQGKGAHDEEDEFSINDDYLPDEYKILRYNKWTLVQLTCLILIVIALACTLAIPNLGNKKYYDLELLKWEIMILVVISGRLVSGWVVRVIVFFIERSFLLRKQVLYFVYGLKNAVQNCIWLGLVLVAWLCIFNKKVERTTYGKKVLPYVTKIWICLLVGTIIWLFKTILIKVLASNFHVNKFFDQIQDSLFNQYVIETLSGPPMIEIQHEQEEEDRMMEEVEKLQSAGANLPMQLKVNMFTGSKGIGTPRTSNAKNSGGSCKKNDEGITINHLHRLNQKNISAFNMNRMMNVINTTMLSTSDDRFQDVTSDDDDGLKQITSENEAKVAAKKIFFNVAKPGFKHIYVDDLMRFLPANEALKTFRLFDVSETKGISKGSLKNWVVKVFTERKALALSLNDTRTAVHKLHRMINVIVGVIIIIIWLLILRVATTHFFIFLSSQLVLVAFVFGNTCKTMFESIIFLFVVHPFDVGDRCEIDGVQMIVEEMNILTTTFLRYDNQKIAYPNSVLTTLPIANFHRSPDMGDAIDFCIHISTSTEKIAKMKERIISYVDNKSEHWHPGPMVLLRDVEDLNRLKISVWLSHRMNFQNMGERWKRRALLVEEMIKTFKDLDIEYRMLPMDINVRNLPELASNRFPSNWTTCAN
ncbi:mechanosensitive ion channel protein 6-like [Rutidosis leptorrhynchoides]|uniref:mechanosensitive ion channel protein 6-like n=1 Tax=Rutidosis leptorrhynchoides TaxID=125765 RepID=UPI003A994DCD